MHQPANPTRNALSIGGLLVLCLIWAWASLRGDMLPGPSTGASLPPLLAEATILAIFAGIAALGALIRKTTWPRDRDLIATISVGLGLFVVPALVTTWTGDWIGASTRVALFSLAPIFAVVFEPYLGDENSSPQRHALPAALLAVVGTLIVFPIDIPRSPASGVAFVGVIVSAACVSAANCVAVRIASQTRLLSFSFAAIAAACAAITLGLVAAAFRSQPATGVPIGAWSTLDLFALVLLFWLMGRMSAVRMTTRFVIAPLLANLIGIAFLHPGVDARGWAGLALIAIGSGWLLLAPAERSETTGSSSLRISS